MKRKRAQTKMVTLRMPLKPTSIKETLGCLNYKGKRKSLKAMEEGMVENKQIEFWLGLGLQVPTNKKTKFSSDDDLWE